MEIIDGVITKRYQKTFNKGLKNLQQMLTHSIFHVHIPRLRNIYKQSVYVKIYPNIMSSLKTPCAEACLLGNQETVPSEKGIKRTVLVSIHGNRATWEHMGIHGALWRINPERAGYIFGTDGKCSNDPVLQDKLSRAMIRNVQVLETNTNIDELISVTIEGLPCMEYTANGDSASIFLTGEGKNTQPQEIFNMSGNTELGLAWMKQYPKYTSYNLDDEGVMFLPGCSYYFVRIDHPIIHMLKTNEDTLGVHITEESIIQGGQWYKIDVEVFIFCIRSIRDNILQNTPSTFNLNNLTVRINKPDGQRWLQLSPQLIDSLISDEVRESENCELIAEARTQAVQRYIDKPLYVTLRLCIEYSLPETSVSEVSVCAAQISNDTVKVSAAKLINSA